MKNYSEDFRIAAVRAWKEGTESQEKVAQILGIHRKTLGNWVKIDSNGGQQVARGRGHPKPALSESDKKHISKLLSRNNSMTLSELRDAIGVKCSLTVYCNAVHELGYTYKKKRYLRKSGQNQI